MIRAVWPHTVIWLGYFVLELAANYVHYGSSRLTELTFHSVLYLPGLMLLTYAVYLGVVPRFKRDLNPWALLLYLIPILVGVYAQRYIITSAVIWDGGSEGLHLPWSKVVKNSIKDASVISIVTSILFVRDWWRQEKHLNRLRDEADSSRLALMLQQLQPHFLFNTFNNIYSLIQQDPSKGGESLLKLSSILEYMVHSRIDQKVALNDELDQVENLIELHRLKYGDSLLATFEVDEIRINIPPMLLLSIIENAFKHGDLDSDVFRLDVKVTNKVNSVDLEIINSISENNVRSDKEGRGFAITQELLKSHYGREFTFKTFNDHARFHVLISIKNEGSNH